MKYLFSGINILKGNFLFIINDWNKLLVNKVEVILFLDKFFNLICYFIFFFRNVLWKK